RSRAGLFVQADKGTILLDEVTEMPLEMQAKLLRVLQSRRVRPVGDDEERSFDARLICATNRPIEEAVASRHFREDLYHRINVVQIVVPPLRKRGDDVLLLAQHFLRRIALRSGKAVRGLTPEAACALRDYDWPGNVRELENAMERAIALTRTDEVSVEELPERVRREPPPITTGGVRELIPLAEVEARYIRQVMRAVGGNKAMAARILGIDRRSLYRRLRDEGEADGEGEEAV
ncbi:MAG TPA: sigma 54-interacting transcriptional regulator, partial [Kofleriaceae bacterium]|nr:sigma 54-interacting transcriptional regulator [Kofleriaceae bacterium]